MMWARLIASAFLLAVGIIPARSADGGTAVGLESCFKAARIADAICSKLPDDPAQRLDCFGKTRAAQLECLEHVLSETPAGQPAGPSAPRDSSGVTAFRTAHRCRITGEFFKASFSRTTWRHWFIRIFDWKQPSSGIQ